MFLAHTSARHMCRQTMVSWVKASFLNSVRQFVITVGRQLGVRDISDSIIQYAPQKTCLLRRTLVMMIGVDLKELN